MSLREAAADSGGWASDLLPVLVALLAVALAVGFFVARRRLREATTARSSAEEAAVLRKQPREFGKEECAPQRRRRRAVAPQAHSRPRVYARAAACGYTTALTPSIRC